MTCKTSNADCLLMYESMCPPSATFFGALGSSLAIVLASFGAAYGTAKSGIAVAHLGIADATKSMKGIVPVVMAGILGIYGLIIAVIISSDVKDGKEFPIFKGYVQLGAGLAGGLASVAAGYVIGIVGDACCFAYRYQDQIFVAMILMLIFAEALGLYGLIIALIMNTTAATATSTCTDIIANGCPCAKSQ
eukprot:TRINITY_DN2020_c0_g1_i3.p2 TRINITY_DN2020_c0_g1~~TRINITY_DN2020_c0_g1_i3.p2  ORF type:complete len:191 (+),score=34.64 TRINITY_DN2020_c0_g1_i3:76-648(+)